MQAIPIATVLVAFAATALVIQVMRPLAFRVNLLDVPGGRKAHFNPTPMVGGIGIFAGVLLASLLWPALLSEFQALLILSALVLFQGVIDDAKDLNVSARMTGHSLVALAMAAVAGNQITSLGVILGPLEIRLGLLTLPFTVFATVGVINAINMADGIDGLSASLTGVALACIAVAAAWSGASSLFSFSLLMLSAAAAFMLFNFRRPWRGGNALVYLGDAGSTCLGFMVAWLMIQSSQGPAAVFSPTHALWFLALPLFDTVNLLIKRPLRGRSPFSPGVDHLHHMLRRRGFSVERTVATLFSAALVLAAIGLAGLYFAVAEWLLFVAFLTLFGIYFKLVDRLEPTVADSVA